MQDAIINVRINYETKSEFDSFCRQIGINTSDLLKIFINKVNMLKKVPFDLSIPDEQENFRQKMKEKMMKEVENTIVSDIPGLETLEDVVRACKTVRNK